MKYTEPVSHHGRRSREEASPPSLAVCPRSLSMARLGASFSTVTAVPLLHEVSVVCVRSVLTAAVVLGCACCCRASLGSRSAGANGHSLPLARWVGGAEWRPPLRRRGVLLEGPVVVVLPCHPCLEAAQHPSFSVRLPFQQKGIPRLHVRCLTVSDHRRG